MAKTRTKYVCQNCGYQSARLFGRCPSCNQFNTMVEEIEEVAKPGKLPARSSGVGAAMAVPQRLREISGDVGERMFVPVEEFNRVLGGGIVPGSIILIGGEPGIGKSTLVIQICDLLSKALGKVLYVSGEESAGQIKMRADRLSLDAEELFLLTETNLGSIFEQVKRINPTILVIDSIQTTYMEEIESSPGSVTQVRECASRLQHLAKSSGVSVFLIGHVTKEGNIAGPRVLEHIVDTVLYLEGDPFQAFRLLRSVKNRFGATSEVGVFEMAGEGMVEVPNPSEAFLAERVINAPGSAIAITMEGTRPLLVELQALTSPTSFGNPRRTPNGVDFNRLLLISAVLSKRVGLRLHEQDIFVNVIGGLKVSEPASDLAMAIAMASSYYDKAVPADLAIVGEVGLSGELRAVGQLPARLNEAAKMGFKRALVPKSRRKLEGVPPSLKLVEVRNLAEALNVAVPRDEKGKGEE
jgi:DNA repair protein RadA/Sms